MTTDAFSICEAIDFGWTKAKDHFWLLVGATFCGMILPVLPVFIVSHLPGVSGDNAGSVGGALASVAGLLQIIVQAGLQLGLVKIALKICDNAEVKFADLFSCFPLFFNCFFGGAIYATIVTFGLLLLIAPGIIWALQFQFFTYAIVDRASGPIACLKASSAITKGEKWHLLLFSLAILLINILGALCLGIGILVSIAISLPADFIAYVYIKLGRAQGAQLVVREARQVSRDNRGRHHQAVDLSLANSFRVKVCT